MVCLCHAHALSPPLATLGEQISYTCKCSFYEIFNEKVFDLVDESNRDNPMGLTVREDTRKGVYVEGLMEEEVRQSDTTETRNSPIAARNYYGGP